MEGSCLLFVCLGNICRSPAAEGVFLHQLQQRGLEQSFRVDSAGTGHWHAGQPADARMRAAAAGRSIHLPSRARQIVVADLDAFDHILTMDDDNLAAVQAMTRGRETKAQIRPITQHCRRHRVREVPDPYYGGADGFERVLDLLDDACEGLIDDLLATGNN